MGVKLVFVVTNFDTRVGVSDTQVGVSVPADCTVEQFKKEFAGAHFKIHPGHGEFRVEYVEVKRESFFYRLPDCTPVALVLDGEDQCLHVKASETGVIDGNLEAQGADMEEPKSPVVNSDYIVPETPVDPHEQPMSMSRGAALRAPKKPKHIDARNMDSSRKLFSDKDC